MDRRRRRVLQACGAAALGLAGCLGRGGPGTESTTRTQTPADGSDTTSQPPPGGSTTSPPDPPTDDRTPAGPSRTRWHVPTERTPGRPVVVDGTCYLGTGELFEGDETSATAALLAVDDAGEVRWRHDTGQVGADVVAVEDGTVYAFSGDTSGPHGDDYRLHAFDADTGDRQWVWAPDMPYKFFEFLGVRDGTVFVGTHDDALEHEGESVHAVADGAGVWTQPEGDVMDGTLVRDTVVTDDPAGLGAFAASDGTERWTFEDSEHGGIDATGFGDLVLAGSARVDALDHRTGSTQWHFDDWTVTSVVVAGERAFVGGEQVAALDRAGATLWTYDRGGLLSDFVTATGLVGTSQYELFVLERADGEERWRIEVDTEFASPGGVADGRLAYGTREGGVVAVDVATGEAAWSWQSRADLGDPVVAAGAFVVGREGGGLWALEP